MSNKTWHKQAFIVFTFDKSMSSLAICMNGWNYDNSVFILQLCWGKNWFSSTFNSKVINCLWVLYCESNVSNTITMFNKMMIYLLVRILLINRAKNKNRTLCVFDNMTGDSSFPSFKTFIGKIFKTKSACIKWSSLFSITYPKGDMIES